MIKKWPLGTFINMATVILGSLIGMALQQSFPEEIKEIVFQGIGLSVLLIGIMMSQKVPEGHLLILIFSMLFGGIMGEMIQLDAIFQQIGNSIKATLSIEGDNFTEGLVTAFLIFCVGSMTIVGAIEEGISNNRELLLVKSLLDGITSIALASSYGIGVLFSIVPMLIFQGGITVMANVSQGFFSEKMIGMLSATGGLLILGLGINILNLGKISVENLLPALLLGAIATWLYDRYQRRTTASQRKNTSDATV